MADDDLGVLVLIVDDEPTVLRSASAALAREGFRVIVAENGVAGLEIFMKSPEDFDLVLTDVVMPYMSGLEMAGRMKEIRGDVKILLMSGYSDAVILPAGGPKYPLLRKPFLQDQLIRTVKANIMPPAASA